jgi:tetratricopeptide (TPR) repeat protein
MAASARRTAIAGATFFRLDQGWLAMPPRGVRSAIAVRCLEVCAFVACAALAGCGDSPGEAPLYDTRGARPLGEASLCTATEEESTCEAQLVPLPPLGERADADPSPQEASLLPPEPLPEDWLAEIAESPPGESQEPLAPAADALMALPALPLVGPEAVALAPHDADAEALLAEASPAMTGLPTGAIVNERARAKIRRGYALAQRGAHFAARSEFVEVLQSIAEAKDQKHGAARRTIALANGLRALDEAIDFVARGPAADGSLSRSVVVASHRTPVAKELDVERALPQQLVDLYLRYAQLQLAGSVAGEPAGSMALHALGKLYSQLGRVEPERHPQADRRAFALQQAALLARRDNHLAAHELGVLLAESGHYVESEYLLSQVALRQPHPMVLRNLARVERRLGREELATASEREAQRLASQCDNAAGVTWTSPALLARTGDPLAPAAPAPAASGPAPPQSRPERPAQPVGNVARRPIGRFY